MTATVLARSAAVTRETMEETPAKHHPSRWRLHRGGIVNVWYYFDSEFTFSGGRCIWRGTNGAGKSRALEVLLPFLLDADRRKIDATGGGKVRLEDLMKAGGAEQSNRVGYLWLELVGTDDDGETEHLTVGALVRFSRSTAEAKAWYFTTPLRVGFDLVLLDDSRLPLSRERLATLIGADRLTDSPEAHRERVRSAVFALTGESGRERYGGLLQLLHTLRSPDIGHRIDEGRLPGILSDALPPLSDAALNTAGEQLDALSETRAAQQRLDEARALVAAFLQVYRRYAAGVLITSADAARAAGTAARAATAHAEELGARHGVVVQELAETTRARAGLDDAASALTATITGIRESKEYAQARDLDRREQHVQALARAADRSLEAATAARNRESELVAEADGRGGEVADAASRASAALRDARVRLDAAGVAGTLPTEVTTALSKPPVASELLRPERESDPVAVARPGPATLTVVPADLSGVATQARAVKRVAETRAGQAAHRLSVAMDLAAQGAEVARAEERADEADNRSEEAAGQASESARKRDEEAVALAVAWRRWVADPATSALLGTVSWPDTAAGALLADLELLSGADAEEATLAPLAELDAVPEAAATPAREAIADRVAALNMAQAEADELRRALHAEQAELRAARDPAPAAAPWHTSMPERAVPLWRAVDFVVGVPAHVRANVEAALHAAGLLTASLAGAMLTAADGEVLVTATGPVAASPLTAVLAPDRAASVDPAGVTAVLERVAFGDRRHPVWVDGDGTWGNGPLTGRHRAPVARHIGTEARAAARAARLAAIELELAELDAGDGWREADRRRITEQRAALATQLRLAPRSSRLGTARGVAADATRRAGAEADRARTMRATATKLRDAWHAKSAAHQAACASFQLPVDADGLASVRRASDEAARACEQVAGRLADVAAGSDRHSAALDRVRPVRVDRLRVEEAADRDWRAWHSECAEFAAVRSNVGRDAARVMAELRAAEARREETTAALKEAHRIEVTLGGRVAAAESEAKYARERADLARGELRSAAEDLQRVMRLPGILAAAVPDGRSLDVTLTEVTPTSVDTASRSVTAAVDRRGGPADENTLIRAQQSLERELSGTFDVLASVTGGVRLVELADATGRRHLADAADDLARRAEEGRSALSDRERRVFTDFVLGGVAEELRRRLGQARQLVDAMNGSLATIRTSHGIGVKVRWNLADEASSPIARLRQLVTTAGEVRTAEQTAELTDLLKQAVDGAFAADATAGYAAHLKAALDYRCWHEVEVIIVGPAPGQERRISRRAKLSQGETRFVSYVTMFAAVDAYLSGLPDTSRALRLILLDDAFAKVDDRTIAELMGLLVRLDIDFAMTGHALWGCYPQVPALDVYEVRRRENTAAVTTHVHWDGRTRHLRAAR